MGDPHALPPDAVVLEFAEQELDRAGVEKRQRALATAWREANVVSRSLSRDAVGAAMLNSRCRFPRETGSCVRVVSRAFQEAA